MSEDVRNVTPLRCSDLTPELLLKYALDDLKNDAELKDMRNAFIILTDSKGQRVVYSTSLSGRELSYICKVLENICMQALRGEIISER